jgi:hypothetical protein
MNKIFLALLAFIILSSSCQKDDHSNEIAYIVFGTYSGLCNGSENCIETYKLTPTELSEDSNDFYPCKAPYQFVLRSNSDFNQASPIQTAFSDEMFDLPDSTFGCPDCLDQGGMYIEIKKNNQIHKWHLDQIKANIPEVFHPIHDEINIVINQLL